MIRSFFYTSQTHKLIAEELASSIGLEAALSREDCHEAHLELSDAGLFFFILMPGHLINFISIFILALVAGVSKEPTMRNLLKKLWVNQTSL